MVAIWFTQILPASVGICREMSSDQHLWRRGWLTHEKKNQKSWRLRMAPAQFDPPYCCTDPKALTRLSIIFFCEDEPNNENEVYVWRLDCIRRVRVRTYRTVSIYLMGSRSLDKQVVYAFGARGRLRRRVSCMDGVCSLYTLRQSRRRKIQPHSQSLSLFSFLFSLCFRWNGSIGTGGSVEAVWCVV